MNKYQEGLFKRDPILYTYYQHNCVDRLARSYSYYGYPFDTIDHFYMRQVIKHYLKNVRHFSIRSIQQFCDSIDPVKNDVLIKLLRSFCDMSPEDRSKISSAILKLNQDDIPSCFRMWLRILEWKGIVLEEEKELLKK